MIFSPRNIIIGIIVAILAVAVPVTIRLAQQQQQLKSQAATTCIDQRDPACSGDDIYCWCRGCTILQQGCTFINYQPGGWQCKGSGDICSGNAVEYVPAGADCSRTTQCVVPSQTVSIGGKVTRYDGTAMEGVVINQNAISPTECNIGTARTDSSGVYRFTLDKDKQFCLRPPQNSSHNPIPPDSSVGVPATPGSYEKLTATTDKTDFDFVYPRPPGVPSDRALCESITIDGQDLNDTTKKVAPGSTHNIEIIMKNPKSDDKISKVWQSNYSLRFKSGTEAAEKLGLNTSSITLGKTVDPGGTFDSGKNIVINIPQTTAGKYNFNWEMHNGSEGFGGECLRDIVVGSTGGPGPTGAYNFELDRISDIEITKGSEDTIEIEVERKDSTSGSLVVNFSASGFPSRVSHDFSKPSCTLPSGVGRTCRTDLTVEVDDDARADTDRITVTAVSDTPSGKVEKEETFDLTVVEPATPFDFTLSTPVDFTLTKGQADPGKNITVKKTAGDAEEVSLSISGDTGGAIASFRASPSCKPDSECQRNLAFDTSQAIPNEYFVEIQGRATNGRTQKSNQFRLIINPGAEPTPSPTPTPTPAPVRKTLCFAMGEGPEGKTAVDSVADCSNIDNKLVFPYTAEPAKINGYAFKDQTPGVKTIFVKFIGLLGATPVFDSKQLSIRFNPSPTISNVSCTHSSSGVGTDIIIAGSNFGAQGKGEVKVANQEITPTLWDEATNTITGKVDQRLDGRISIEVKTDDNRVAKGECVVNTTTVTFKTLQACKPAGSFGASNVDIKVFESLPFSTDAKAPEPVLRQKISLSKDGEPQNFAPKFEKNKKYQLIIKAPGTIGRRVEFDTKDGGTTNIEAVIKLPQGDVSPANSPDGKINALDKSEMIRQWNIVTDVAKTADLNGDSRVNSIDYSCMRANFNATDDSYSAPVPSPSPVASPVVGPSPSASASATPAPTSTATPSATPVASPTASPTPSPTPVGGPGGVSFRVSFDPGFATIDASGLVDEITGEAIIDITLPPGPGTKNVYVQFSEDGGITWGPIPPSVGTITLL